MAGAMFFILGAFFSLLLVISVAMLLAGIVAPEQASKPQNLAAARAARPSASRANATPQREYARLGYQAGPARAHSAGQRDSYRILTQLTRCEAALARIAEQGEPAAAKIAEQTLRRLRNGAEPAQARLAFALARLELLSLRPETRARRAASDLLASLA